jgi:predicted DNA-binding protein (MmcQ/YjbR family)
MVAMTAGLQYWWGYLCSSSNRPERPRIPAGSAPTAHEPFSRRDRRATSSPHVRCDRPAEYHRHVAHDQMFDDDDPFLERVRQLAAELPNTGEKVSHGRPAFFTGKVFAYYGGSLKVDGEWIQHPQSIVVQPDEGDRRALLEDDRVYVPAYLGPSGWIGIDLDAASDWSEIAELLDASFRLTAPARDVAELDARR